MSDRDSSILEHIIRYCNEIDEAKECFGNTFEKLQANKVYRNAVAMCILQIGELANHLTEEFKKLHTEMPWQDIVAMRNVAAHRYGSFDVNMLWDTITNDVPALREYCNKVLINFA